MAQPTSNSSYPFVMIPGYGGSYMNHGTIIHNDQDLDKHQRRMARGARKIGITVEKAYDSLESLKHDLDYACLARCHHLSDGSPIYVYNTLRILWNEHFSTNLRIWKLCIFYLLNSEPIPGPQQIGMQAIRLEQWEKNRHRLQFQHNVVLRPINVGSNDYEPEFTIGCKMCPIVYPAPLLRCEGCKLMAYCCEAHQLLDWPDHKKGCRMMKNLYPHEFVSTVEELN